MTEMIPWKSRETTHEGFPLMLRCPQDLPFDRQPEFPRLVVLTHHLEQVTASGLPVAEYNDILADFDHAAIEMLSSTDVGVTVLVETFGGKRTYYSYAAESVDVDDQVARLLEQFPGVHLEHSVRKDVEWGFIRRYAADYGM